MIELPEMCPCCGGREFEAVEVLDSALVEEWELSLEEVTYVNLQQGFHCKACGNNLRGMVLARAITRAFGFSGTFAAFLETERARRLRVLEINESAVLTPFFRTLGAAHTLATFPAVDMCALPYEAERFDLVVHSDTLEHVRDPIAGLRECRRVLAPSSVLAFTVPMIVGRMTRDRDDLPPSYHSGGSEGDDVRVRTEYGADAWQHVFAAGFVECRIAALAPPAAHAFVAIK